MTHMYDVILKNNDTMYIYKYKAHVLPFRGWSVIFSSIFDVITVSCEPSQSADSSKKTKKKKITRGEEDKFFTEQCPL